VRIAAAFTVTLACSPLPPHANCSTIAKEARMANRRTPDLPRTPVVISTKKRVRPRTSPIRDPLTAGALTAGTVSDETRRGMIAQAAYLRAEQRGFASGYELEDWLLAEGEVDALLSAHRGTAPQ
jgi:hypothetical protein